MADAGGTGVGGSGSRPSNGTAGPTTAAQQPAAGGDATLPTPAEPTQQQQPRQHLLRPSEISFDTLCRFFVGMRRVKGPLFKRLAYIKRFIEVNIDKSSKEAFQVFRLVLPKVGGWSGWRGGWWVLAMAPALDACVLCQTNVPPVYPAAFLPTSAMPQRLPSPPHNISTARTTRPCSLTCTAWLSPCTPLQCDNKRRVYNLLETRLADAVIIAASLDKKGEVARAVRDWKRPGARNSGDFASVLKHVGCRVEG
jgi:hypothetical protein